MHRTLTVFCFLRVCIVLRSEHVLCCRPSCALHTNSLTSLLPHTCLHRGCYAHFTEEEEAEAPRKARGVAQGQAADNGREEFKARMLRLSPPSGAVRCCCSNTWQKRDVWWQPTFLLCRSGRGLSGLEPGRPDCMPSEGSSFLMFPAPRGPVRSLAHSPFLRLTARVSFSESWASLFHCWGVAWGLHWATRIMKCSLRA